jgi:transposase-like protein
MADLPESNVSYEVVCPHCRKPFTAEVISGGAARYAGFKCPHCKLFVPYERADERDLVERVD